MTKNQIIASKCLSYALRHNPGKFGIELDSEGWVDIDVLCKALGTHEPRAYITKKGIEDIIASSEKKRFEINGNKIRATYGHSINQKIAYLPQEPPAVLFHGTACENLESIRKEGLKPMSRQYVHLSSDYNTAEKVGRRHSKKITVWYIDARMMYKEGFNFFHTANDTTWLCNEVPYKYMFVRG